ncbi:uncharacterized protein A1O5_01040 [Cladophialophora psammophila CBS 110553]|uniref:Heterokaryon incompatibility domain-containing protein n=1 Tax=Cladophialophora psammophila CBS 110553 TaxID=1182543 RepID=W9X7S5_9EURO|nr:uncharacterized protein A1O5_01040 [Cladophialophora psammophila CBS 110553]EXJ76532.1 hypothetical protein A1O5_01040 [Cladophialophora psammophila CBS 110553]
MNLPRYKYMPLNASDEIRVFELSPTKTRIEIRILHVPASARCFDALSYVWGSPAQSEKATVLDKLGRPTGWIPLTRNLSNAMADLRDAEQLKTNVFWIDQVCINQRDEEEKNDQVAMMNQIYTQSRRVITYLGPAELEVKENGGIRLLDTVCKTVPEGTWQQMHESGSLQQIQDQVFDGSIKFKRLPSNLELRVDRSYYESEISERYAEQGWEWLVRVAYGEWTQRLWIVQEQLLNKEIITLRGHRLIDWDAITAIPILFAISHLPQEYRDMGRRNLEGKVPWDEVEKTMYGIRWDRHARLVTETSYTWSSLFHNLQWYQSLLCGDARDRVYAILAISKDAKRLDLKPDYSPLNTADMLSRKLSIRVLENARNLELISFAFSWRPPNSTLPSWCFTLDRPANLTTPDLLPLEVYTPHPKQHGFHLARFHTNDSILVVKGRILDYVSTPNPSAGWPHVGDVRQTSPVDIISSLGYLLHDGFSIEDVVSLLCTITARAPWSPPPGILGRIDETMAFHFWTYLRHKSHLLAKCVETSSTTIKELLLRCHHIMTRIQALTPGFTYSEPERNEDVAKEEYLACQRVLRYALEKGRCLGRTRAGRFCNAMCPIQEGDAIVALQGADQLFTMRLVGHTYRLIGDIFVDGLMHGEAYKNQDPDNIDYDIELA